MQWSLSRALKLILTQYYTWKLNKTIFFGKSATFRLQLWACPFLCVSVTIIRTGHTMAKIKHVNKSTL